MITLNQFKQLKRYKIRALQYTHRDESHLMRDYRKDKQVKPEFRHIHYVGFEVCTEDRPFYYHTTILADCTDALYAGVTEIHRGLSKRFAILQEITLVYLRSYLTADEDHFDSEIQETLRIKIDALSHKKKINQFMAFMLIGNSKITSMQADGHSAIEIFSRLHTSLQERDCGENLTFLWVCAAHPVSVEYSEHFDYAAARLKMMIDESLDWKSCTIH